MGQINNEIVHMQCSQEETPSAFDKVVLHIEQLRAVGVKTYGDRNLQLAPLHAIDWQPSLNLLNHGLKIICHISRLTADSFTMSPAIIYRDESANFAWLSAVIIANDGITISAEIQQEIDAAFVVFAKKIVGSEETNQGFELNYSGSTETKEIATTVADEFLTTSGGKTVGEARLLKTRNSICLISGAYKPKQGGKLPEPEKWSVIGSIDGIRCVNRTAYLLIDERKSIQTVFDESRVKNKLIQGILDGHAYQCTIQTEWLSHSKKVDVLLNIEPCSDTDITLV